VPVEFQAELDARVDEGVDRLEGNHDRLGDAAEVQRDREAVLHHRQVLEPLLQDDRHVLRVALLQRRRHVHARMRRVEVDEKMVLSRQPFAGDLSQNVRHHLAERLVHQHAVIDRLRHMPVRSARPTLADSVSEKRSVLPIREVSRHRRADRFSLRNSRRR
jgi:hypothetical protein